MDKADSALDGAQLPPIMAEVEAENEQPRALQPASSDQLLAEGVSLSTVVRSLKVLGEPHRAAVETYFLKRAHHLEAVRILESLAHEYGSSVARALRALCGADNLNDAVSLKTGAGIAELTDQTGPSNSVSVKHARPSRETNEAKRKQIETFIRQRTHALKIHHIRHADGVLDLVHTSAVAQLQRIICLLTHASRRRQDITAAYGVRRLDSPKTIVRESNALLEDGSNLRAEEERRAIILAGANMAKRGRAVPDDDISFKEKVTKVLQEEEDRATTSATNKAVRSALGGDAKYLRWSQVAHEPAVKMQSQEISQDEMVASEEIKISKTAINIDKDGKKSVSLIDLFVAIGEDSSICARTPSQQFRAQRRLYY